MGMVLLAIVVWKTVVALKCSTVPQTRQASRRILEECGKSPFNNVIGGLLVA
jgi:hypothetical protein